jgi:hypothetical protein
MRGTVWVLLLCYITNRRGNIFGKEKVYGYAKVRDISTIHQQKMQYNNAINKALAVYRSHNNLDSDTEVGFTTLNSGIIYEGSRNGMKVRKRKKTKLTGADKRKVRTEVLQNQKTRQKGLIVTPKEQKKMYSKKITEKQFNKKVGKKQLKNRKQFVKPHDKRSVKIKKSIR